MKKFHAPVLCFRALKESFINLWRNKVLSLATITVITIIALIFNILYVINISAKESLAEFSGKVDMILYLKDDVEYHTAKNIIEDVEKIEGVTEVNYTSKKEALEKLAETYPKIKDFFAKFAVENPLPASINIKTEHPSRHKNVLKFIENSRYKNLFDQNVLGEKQENKFVSGVTLTLRQITEITERILYFVLAVFVLGGILIIFNAIKLTIYARRKEIEVMKLVGASRFFIKLPYALEGIWYFAIALIINLLLWDPVISEFAFAGPSVKMWALLCEFLAGIVIATVSTTLASTKHLNA